MSRERELLERAYQYIPMSSITSEEIRDYLMSTKPENIDTSEERVRESDMKREALSEKAIGLESELIRKRLLGSQGLTEFGWFAMGVRFAERHHGIGGEG